MVTIVDIPSIVPAIRQGTFSAYALHIIQPYRATSGTKPGLFWSTKGLTEPKFITNDMRVIHIPVVVTNSSPGTIVENLHSSFSFEVSIS